MDQSLPSMIHCTGSLSIQCQLMHDFVRLPSVRSHESTHKSFTFFFQIYLLRRSILWQIAGFFQVSLLHMPEGMAEGTVDQQLYVILTVWCGVLRPSRFLQPY